MEILGMILFAVGGIIFLIGGLWFLLVTFQESILWGLGCLFVPLVSLFFLVIHWEDAKKPFLVQLAGCVPMFLGGFLMPEA